MGFASIPKLRLLDFSKIVVIGFRGMPSERLDQWTSCQLLRNALFIHACPASCIVRIERTRVPGE